MSKNLYPAKTTRDSKNAPTAAQAQKALRLFADADKAVFLQRFFKTGPGQYGENDRFLGINVPVTRSVARDFKNLAPAEIKQLLASPFHEDRLLALVILTQQVAPLHRNPENPSYAKACEKHLRFYFSQIQRVNNWDLVDVSARIIVGDTLRVFMPRAQALNQMTRWAQSSHLWTRRVAMIATHAFIRHGDLEPTLRIAEFLLGDTQDLMHKAVGWMLREAGKKDPGTLRAFLRRHASKMPRTALRYAIEKFSDTERKRWMQL